jgi:hypothetical protein
VSGHTPWKVLQDRLDERQACKGYPNIPPFRRRALWNGFVDLELGNAGLHVWVGPFGVHLNWPPGHTRFGYMANWREPVT